MLPLLHRVANAMARRQVEKKSDVEVAASAKVNWRGIRGRPPGHLVIGEGSIFEGAMASDRAGSTVRIGDHSFVGNSTIVTASRVEIGNDVLISWGCTLIDHDSHALDWAGRKNDVREHYHGRKSWDAVKTAPVLICDRAWLGMHVIVLKGVTVGEGAVVAAGSVVTRDVPAYSLVAGNPARIIRKLSDDAH